MNHIVAAFLVTEHLNDLHREAEEGRRGNLLRGTRRSAWSAFAEKVAGLRGGSAGTTRRDRPASTSTGTHPAAA